MPTVLSNLPKDIKTTDRIIRLKKFQDEFIFTDKRYPALVSAWGTGKTMSLIEKCKIAAETFPKNLGFIVRKEFTDLRDSTIKDWNETTGITVNSAREAVFSNGSIVMFRHAEELTGDNLSNMNLGFFALEQAEEFDTDEPFFRLQGRLRRPGIKHFGAIIANTRGHNWIYNLWKIGKDDEYPLSEATSFDNEDILPADTIRDWRKMEEKKPKIFRRFVMNSWEEADTVDVIIQPSWVDAASKRTGFVTHHPIRRVVSIDVARGGADKSVFYAIEDNKALGVETWETRNTMELVGRAQVFAKKHDTYSFAVDEIGVGGGVVDRLKELEYEVIPVNAAEREGVADGYFNRRAEILGNGAKLFEEGRVMVLKDDKDLHEQLSWTKWRPMKSNGVLQAESKDDVRSTYGRSPDNADAFLNGLWALPKASASGERKLYSPVGSMIGQASKPKHGRTFRRYMGGR